ncbi:MAG TPA: ATP-binding protein [Ramlibacter sp.]|nr:ATP-binding protein [Ramlibacter sp.]
MGSGQESAACQSVDAVIATHLLRERPQRPPALASENDALLALAQSLAQSSEGIADQLVRQAMRLCQADSAGLSLVDEHGGEDIFRWIATAGEYARYRDGTMPRHFSPCGEVLKRGVPLLMQSPERHYPYVNQLHTPVREVLLVPFESGGAQVGTIWVVSHSADKQFDSEDLRIVKSLAVFASAVSATVGLVQDLKRRAESANRRLAQAERQRAMLAQWFAQSPGFMAILRGPTHIFEVVNQAYADAVGHRELAGRPMAQALPELEEQGFVALLDQVYAGGKPHVGRDVKISLRARGDAAERELYVDFVYQPLFDVQGKVDGIFVQGHEVTQRHAAIAALHAADRHKDEFIAKVSHELRNPLSPIKVAVQVLKRQPAAQEPMLARMIDVIDRQATAITALVDDLLDVSRMRTGKIVVRPEHIDFQDVLASALEMCRPQVEAQLHRLEVQVPPGPVPLHADAQRLVQVACNLIANAAKYTPPGGLVRVVLEREPGHAVLRVSDNGIGIPPALLDRIFDLYQQAPEAQNQTQGGLGIGLALVRQLVELHGGSCSAASDGPGLGSTFTVKLPAAD